MSRLTIDISDEQHQSLKALAALQGKSIRQFAIERLFPDDADEARLALHAMLGERIAEALSGAVSSKDFDAIVDEEMARDSGV